MSRLVKNVWVGDRGYGPGFGPDLPPADADLPDDVWADDDVEVVLPAPPPPGHLLDADGNVTPYPPTPDPVDPEPVLPTSTEAAPLPLDDLTRDELVSIAISMGIKPDGRWGAPRLRREITAARGES